MLVQFTEATTRSSSSCACKLCQVWWVHGAKALAEHHHAQGDHGTNMWLPLLSIFRKTDERSRRVSAWVFTERTARSTGSLCISRFLGHYSYSFHFVRLMETTACTTRPTPSGSSHVWAVRCQRSRSSYRCWSSHNHLVLLLLILDFLSSLICWCSLASASPTAACLSWAQTGGSTPAIRYRSLCWTHLIVQSYKVSLWNCQNPISSPVHFIQNNIPLTQKLGSTRRQFWELKISSWWFFDDFFYYWLGKKERSRELMQKLKIIWVGFPRSGILPVLCHFLKKTLPLWPNQIYQATFLNCSDQSMPVA